MTVKSNLPLIPTQLIEALEKRFPNAMPNRLCSLEDIRFQQGEVAVVAFMRRQYNIQNTPTTGT